MRDYTTIHLDTTRIIDVMIRVFTSSRFGPPTVQTRLWNWYLLTLRYARSTKEKEQRLVGSVSG